MFVGHYAAALLARRAEPRLPLGALFIAAQLVDVFWALFVLIGVERVRIVPGLTESNGLDLVYIPFSHSLVPATIGWALMAALAWRLVRPTDGGRAALLFGLVVASHWLLDLPMHRPDLPLVWDSYKVGFGLWNDRPLALAFELAVLGAAMAWAAPSLPRPRRAGALVLLMALLEVAAAYGPQPQTPAQVAVIALVGYIVLAAAAHAVDRRVAAAG